MIYATLVRNVYTDQGTFGEFTFGKRKYLSGELPWRENRRTFSCIPTGIYTCVWNFSPKFRRKTYELVSVNERSGIRIHPANYMGDSKLGLLSELDGCIALGKMITISNGQRMLMRSREAVADFESVVDGQDFTLEISNYEACG